MSEGEIVYFNDLFRGWSDLEDIVNLVYTIKESKLVNSTTGLVHQGVTINGDASDELQPIYTKPNLFWALALKATNHEKEAKKVIENLQKGLPRDYDKNGQPTYYYPLYPDLDHHLDIGLLQLQDRLLHTLVMQRVGFEKEAKREVEAIKVLPNKFLPKGIIAEIRGKFRDEKDSKNIIDKYAIVHSTPNILWILALQATGYEGEAKQLVEDIKLVPDLFRENGLLVSEIKLSYFKGIPYLTKSNFIRKNKFKKDTSEQQYPRINSKDNSLWVLALKATGYEQESQQVVKSMRLNLTYTDSNLIMNNQCPYPEFRETVNKYLKQYPHLILKERKSVNDEGSLEAMLLPQNNCLFALALKATGYEQEAEEVLEKIIQVDYISEINGLIATDWGEDKYDINMSNQALWILAKSKEEHKMFGGTRLKSLA